MNRQLDGHRGLRMEVWLHEVYRTIKNKSLSRITCDYFVKKLHIQCLMADIQYYSIYAPNTSGMSYRHRRRRRGYTRSYALISARAEPLFANLR